MFGFCGVSVGGKGDGVVEMNQLKMTIAKPETEDFEDAWAFIRMLNLVTYDLNPLKTDTDGEYEYLADEDKSDVLDAVVEKFNECSLEWMLSALQALMSPEMGIINQDSDTLELHPKLKGGAE